MGKQLLENKLLLQRTLTGSPVTADAALSPSVPVRSERLNAAGWQEIAVQPIIGGGTSPTVTVEVCGYNEVEDLFFVLGTISGAASKSFNTVKIYGLNIFLRVSAVTGNPTSVKLYAVPTA